MNRRVGAACAGASLAQRGRIPPADVAASARVHSLLSTWLIVEDKGKANMMEDLLPAGMVY